MKTLAILFSLLLALSSPAYSFSEWGESWALADQGVGVTVVEDSVFTGTLFGDTSTTNLLATSFGANQVLCNKYNAVASGILTKGYLYQVQNDGDSVKLVVYNSSFSLIAQSDVVAGISGVPKWQQFSFSGVNQVTITSGNEYYLGIISNNMFSLSNENGVGTLYYSTGGTFASPPNPVTFSTGTRRLGVYVTGGD